MENYYLNIVHFQNFWPVWKLQINWHATDNWVKKISYSHRCPVQPVASLTSPPREVLFQGLTSVSTVEVGRNIYISYMVWNSHIASLNLCFCTTIGIFLVCRLVYECVPLVRSFAFLHHVVYSRQPVCSPGCGWWSSLSAAPQCDTTSSVPPPPN